MKVARISVVEFKSEESLMKMISSISDNFDKVFTHAESSVFLRTGEKSGINIGIYPSEDAAKKNLEARNNWVESIKDLVLDQFYYEGEIYHQAVGQTQIKTKNNNTVSLENMLSIQREQTENLMKEVGELKSLINQVILKN